MYRCYFCMRYHTIIFGLMLLCCILFFQTNCSLNYLRVVSNELCWLGLGICARICCLPAIPDVGVYLRYTI